MLYLPKSFRSVVYLPTVALLRRPHNKESIYCTACESPGDLGRSKMPFSIFLSAASAMATQTAVRITNLMAIRRERNEYYEYVSDSLMLSAHRVAAQPRGLQISFDASPSTRKNVSAFCRAQLLKQLVRQSPDTSKLQTLNFRV